eukprot:11133863-Karenia_brevis.AAC.1
MATSTESGRHLYYQDLLRTQLACLHQQCYKSMVHKPMSNAMTSVLSNCGLRRDHSQGMDH